LEAFRICQFKTLKNLIITGSNGFVGLNLTKYLSESDFNIIPLNRTSQEFNWGNIFDEGIPNGIDSIIHLAGKAHDLKGVSNFDEYIRVNTELTIKLFEEFLKSDARKFIYFSSVKACCDVVDEILNEDHNCNPTTSYGISKLKAENSILNLFENYNQQFDINNVKAKQKYLYIMRPCMIHGPHNKGNLNILFSFINKRIPYPLGLFGNRRSFLSIGNLGFVMKEILINPIESGIYNLADNDTISTIEVIKLMGQIRGVKPMIWNIPKGFIIFFARIGDFFRLPFNTHSLIKLTESYRVSNKKIVTAIGKPLPMSIKDGLKSTFVSLMK
jgi:nucleoside-diphosphate-sugar epimerase